VRDPSDSLASAAEVLDGLGARWAVIGALAAMHYRATPRATADVDILAEYVDGIAEAFRSRGYHVRLFAEEGEEPHMLAVRGKGDRIDVLFPAIDYQRVALSRARDHVITVEDVIVHKLIAWRPRDRDDVLSILELAPQIDEDYVREWARRWDVLDRWEQVRRSR
jgi:hypothetical protein